MNTIEIRREDRDYTGRNPVLCIDSGVPWNGLQLWVCFYKSVFL